MRCGVTSLLDCAFGECFVSKRVVGGLSRDGTAVVRDET